MRTAVTLGIGIIMVLFQLSDIPNPPGQKRTAGAVVIEASVEVALCKARQRLETVIGVIRPGVAIHYATSGDWSTHDLVMHIAALIGPAHLTASTWSISEPAVRQIIRALGDGRLLSLGLLADWRVPTSCPEALQLAKANASRYRLTSIHAKVSVLHNATAQIVIVGSANITNNPRIEAGVITADARAAQFHHGWIEAELADASPFDMSDPRGRGDIENG